MNTDVLNHGYVKRVMEDKGVEPCPRNEADEFLVVNLYDDGGVFVNQSSLVRSSCRKTNKTFEGAQAEQIRGMGHNGNVVLATIIPVKSNKKSEALLRVEAAEAELRAAKEALNNG